MERISRRGALRLAGVAGAAGVTAAAGGASLAPALAADARSRRAATLRPAQRAVARTTLIGMSTPVDVWDARARAVGPGLGARRIFADLAVGATSQIKLVERAIADGMMPVISYKVGRDAAAAASGRFNAAAEAAATKLASYNVDMAVTVWHEPYGDLTGAQYTAITKKILPVFKRGRLRVGPIINGWLLDNQVSTFASYCPDELFSIWSWFGIDAYESGSMASPGKWKPADRILAVRKYLDSRGRSTLPIGVGEYNGYTPQSIEAAGEALFSTKAWFGCLWNTTGGRGQEVTGDRLAAFKRTMADPRRALNGKGL